MDNGGRYFYIKDGDTVWNPGWKPCKTPLDFYECRHGMSYTRITGKKNGVEASVLFFVPLKKWTEVQKLTLKNESNETKSLELFSFEEWCLWNAATDMENFQRNFSTGEVEIEGSTIYHKTEYRERRNHYAFYHVNAPIQGTAADIIKLAMIRVSERLRKEGLKSRMVLQIHDELLLEVPEAEIDAARAVLTEEMQGVMELSVPLTVECNYGKTWLEAH